MPGQLYEMSSLLTLYFISQNITMRDNQSLISIEDSFYFEFNIIFNFHFTEEFKLCTMYIYLFELLNLDKLKFYFIMFENSQQK